MNYSSRRTKKAGYAAVNVGSLIDRILAGFGLKHNLAGWRIVTLWPQIVGDKIGKVSKAIRFSEDTLLISVPDDVWRQQLSLEVEAIMDKIHQIPGGRVIKKIHFIS